MLYYKMLIDLKNPIQISIITFAIVFIISSGILVLTHPTWVQNVDKKTGKTSTSWVLLVLYALIFALVTAIAALLLASNKHDKTKSNHKYADEH